MRKLNKRYNVLFKDNNETSNMSDAEVYDLLVHKAEKPEVFKLAIKSGAMDNYNDDFVWITLRED